MTVDAFKIRFARLTEDQKRTAVQEMERAKPEDYLRGIPKVRHQETILEFNKLIEWCNLELSK